MTRHKRRPLARRLKSLYLWHRYIGLTAALFVILLATTGLLLNHTGELALDSRHIQSGLLLDWYGIKVPDDMSSYRAGSVIVTSLGERIYLNTAPLSQAHAPLVGALEFSALIIIAAGGQLFLYTPQGDLVERLDATAGVPPAIQALGLSAPGLPVVRSPVGIYQSDSKLLEWRKIQTPEATWSHPVAAPPELVTALQQAYRGTGLSLERVLLDAHSGRILGVWGVYLVDAAAFLFLLLACSGIWLWARRRKSLQAHRQSRGSHPAQTGNTG
jgi:hypothetical protein